MRKLAVLVLFTVMTGGLVATPSTAQEPGPVPKNLVPLYKTDGAPLKVPAEIKAEVGDFVVISAETEGKAVMFYPIDSGLKRFPPDLLNSKKAAVFSAPKAGRYRVLVYTSVNDVPTEPAIVTVIVGDAPPGPGPGPGPDPGPGPIPPPNPVDPLTATLQKAYDAEPQADKKDKLALFIPCMEKAAEYANDPNFTTAGELEKAVRLYTTSRVGNNQLPNLGKAVVEYLTKDVQFPDDPNAKLTPELRVKLYQGYDKLSKSLKGVK